MTGPMEAAAIISETLLETLGQGVASRSASRLAEGSSPGPRERPGHGRRTEIALRQAQDKPRRPSTSSGHAALRAMTERITLLARWFDAAGGVGVASGGGKCWRRRSSGL